MSEPPVAHTGPIGLYLALRAVDAGIRHAESLGIAVSLAVVDSGGVLKAFARMDGAEVAGEVLAVDKAFTALALRSSTAELAPLAEAGGELFGLHAAGRGRYVLIGGGLPVSSAAVVVGAVGVSGGSVEQDVRCAEAMLAALLAGF